MALFDRQLGDFDDRMGSSASGNQATRLAILILSPRREQNCSSRELYCSKTLGRRFYQTLWQSYVSPKLRQQTGFDCGARCHGRLIECSRSGIRQYSLATIDYYEALYGCTIAVFRIRLPVIHDREPNVLARAVFSSKLASNFTRALHR